FRSMLMLKQVVTGQEPETITFEVPVNYDALTNIGELTLCIDPVAPNEDDEGWMPSQVECKRGPDGNCLLVWRTIYETPGRHVLMAALVLDVPSDIEDALVGPPVIHSVSNFCHFSQSSVSFYQDTGALFHARLPEMKASYVME